MTLKVTKIDVWAGDIADQPGGLASMLKVLTDAGASLDGLIARRKPDQPGKGVVFLSPIKGKKVIAAARSLGMSLAADVSSLKVEGPDKKGMGACMTAALAAAGINMRGLSAMTTGRKFVAYFGFDSKDAAAKAAKILKKM